jgi:hypothetical protein
MLPQFSFASKMSKKLFTSSIVTTAAVIAFHGTSFAQSSQVRSYCAVEVGSKGVKARGFNFGITDPESAVKVFFKKDINTTIIASLEGNAFSQSAIIETAEATKSLIKEMQASSPSCKPFVVGSSGISKVKNTKALSDAISQRIDVGVIEFVTPAQEAEFGFISSIPRKDWNNSVLVDIGSSNTKMGYRSDSGFKAAEIPFGSVTLTQKASGGSGDFYTSLKATINTIIKPALRDTSSKLPSLMNRKKVFWIGGAAWSTATFMRPDQGTRDFVKMSESDISRFIAALNDKTWVNYKPSRRASAKARAVFESDSSKVIEIFSRDNLLSGVSLFESFLSNRGVDGPVYFARNGNWIMGYAASRFRDDIWREDSLD